MRPVRAAYGALTRVRHPEWTPNLPVPRAVRAQIGYLASLLAPGVDPRGTPLVVPRTVILVAMGARFVLLSAADLVATVPYAPRYYQPLFPLLLLFIGLNTYTVCQLAGDRCAPRGREHGPGMGSGPRRGGAMTPRSRTNGPHRAVDDDHAHRARFTRSA
jgi:hypothetical protein